MCFSNIYYMLENRYICIIRLWRHRPLLSTRFVWPVYRTLLPHRKLYKCPWGRSYPRWTRDEKSTPKSVIGCAKNEWLYILSYIHTLYRVYKIKYYGLKKKKTVVGYRSIFKQEYFIILVGRFKIAYPRKYLYFFVFKRYSTTNIVYIIYIIYNNKLSIL